MRKEMNTIAKWLTCLCLPTLLLACAEKQKPASLGVGERWRVQHYKAPCTGEGTQMCYLVDRGNGQFEYLYDEIEGFRYQWGFTHEISVIKLPQQQPMADASSLQYRLQSLLARQRAPREATFRLTLIMDGESVIQVQEGACSLLNAIVIETSQQECEVLRTRDSAVFRHHETRAVLVPAI